MIPLALVALGLWVIAGIAGLVMMFRTFRISVPWGLFFLFMPIVFFGFALVLGPVIGGVLIIIMQFYFVRTHWEKIGRPFMIMLLCWIGSSVIAVSARGLIPQRTLQVLRNESTVRQAGAPVVAATEGYLPMMGGRVWYRRSGNGAGTPVILLHGGPGAASFYLKPLEALGDDRVVVRYDQLGSGHSQRTTDTTQFTIARFVRELDSLRSALGFEQVHLVGHSWGTILALEYYRAHPAHVKSLVLGSPALSAAEWSRNARKLIATLPDSTQRVIRQRESLRDYDAPDYVAAVGEYYARYVWLRPVQEDLDSTMHMMAEAQYKYMWGPSEFTATGTLRNYDGTRWLRSVKVPTLFTVGEFDEAGPDIVKRHAKLVRGARVEVIPNAAHITTWDNPDEMLRVVREFLRAADGG